MAVGCSDILQRRDFLPAAAVAAISPDSLNETWCREWLIRKVHQGEDAQCPYCSTLVTGQQVEAFYAGRRMVCKECRTGFDARTRTILFGAPRDYSRIFCLVLLLGLGIKPKEIASCVGMSRSTVYEWKDKLALCPLV